MSFGNTSENDVMAFVFNGTALPGTWPAAGGTWYVALYTADPGETGTAPTNEATYTNYLRVASTRNSSGFTVSTNSISNTSAITFAQCGVTGNTITHWALVQSSSGAGQIFIKGALTAPLAVSNLITPSFASGQLTASLD